MFQFGVPRPGLGTRQGALRGRPPTDPIFVIFVTGFGVIRPLVSEGWNARVRGIGRRPCGGVAPPPVRRAAARASPG
jgi:hypothetical protein